MAVATQTLRIGVLGVGRIGRMHAELLARQVPGAAVTAVYDAYGPTAREVAARLGVPAAETAQELIAAARAGKAVFCE
jgi:myo-inositol 2-dehydrogenase/D-chiro-inositol 1-dehydrogenase